MGHRSWSRELTCSPETASPAGEEQGCDGKQPPRDGERAGWPRPRVLPWRDRAPQRAGWGAGRLRGPVTPQTLLVHQHREDRKDGAPLGGRDKHGTRAVAQEALLCTRNRLFYFIYFLLMWPIYSILIELAIVLLLFHLFLLQDTWDLPPNPGTDWRAES